MNVRPFALLFLLTAASASASADYWGDYGNAWMGDQVRRDRPERFWTDLVARPAKPPQYPNGGPRSWDADEQNPWANTYGTPSANRWRATTVQPYYSEIVRMCSCYLPADARSWDGGPLTQADITRRCHAQCY